MKVITFVNDKLINEDELSNEMSSPGSTQRQKLIFENEALKNFLWHLLIKFFISISSSR